MSPFQNLYRLSLTLLLPSRNSSIVPHRRQGGVLPPHEKAQPGAVRLRVALGAASLRRLTPLHQGSTGNSYSFGFALSICSFNVLASFKQVLISSFFS